MNSLNGILTLRIPQLRFLNILVYKSTKTCITSNNTLYNTLILPHFNFGNMTIPDCLNYKNVQYEQSLTQNLTHILNQLICKQLNIIKLPNLYKRKQNREQTGKKKY